jgi:hypothetical protein
MIQYSLLGHTAASIRLNATFRGLAPSPSSGKTAKYVQLYFFLQFVLFAKTLINEYTYSHGRGKIFGPLNST